MSLYESNDKLGGGVGGDKQGTVVEKTAGPGPDGRPSQSLADRLRGTTANDARKTVTFGDGSAVVGNPLFSIGTVLILLILWFFSEALGLVDETFFPGPIKTWKEFVLVLTDGFQNVTLAEHVYWSLRRILLGFGIGVAVGIPIGLAMGLSNALRGIFDPLIELFRPVPPLAFIPLLILWFGIGETSKVVMLFFAAFFIMVISARAGVTGVRISKVHAAYSLGASKTQVLRSVILPNALPEIFVGMRVALGVCWGTLVAAELVGAQKGLGAMIWTARTFFRNGIVVFGIILIGLIGVLLDLGMRKLEERFIPWRGRG